MDTSILWCQDTFMLWHPMRNPRLVILGQALVGGQGFLIGPRLQRPVVSESLPVIEIRPVLLILELAEHLAIKETTMTGSWLSHLPLWKIYESVRMIFHSQLFLESQNPFHGSSHHRPNELIKSDGQTMLVIGFSYLYKDIDRWYPRPGFVGYNRCCCICYMNNWNPQNLSWHVFVSVCFANSDHSPWRIHGAARNMVCHGPWIPSIYPSHVSIWTSTMDPIWVCLKIVYPYTQWLMIIIPTKWP